MTIEEIRNKVFMSNEYEFLKNDEPLGNNLILLYLSGSYAYGTNADSSDIDLRGIRLNSKREILLGQDIGAISDTNTDTMIYSFKKMVKMLCSNNPSAIEIFGLNPEHILFVSYVGEDLLKRKDMFLTKKVGYAFRGYIENSLKLLESEKCLNNRELMGKYMVHPVRLFFMISDILKNHEVKTYRYVEHDLLIDIRHGRFITSDGKPNSEYCNYIEAAKLNLDYMISKTDLPDKVNRVEIDDYVASVCEMIVKEEFV